MAGVIGANGTLHCGAGGRVGGFEGVMCSVVGQRFRVTTLFKRMQIGSVDAAAAAAAAVQTEPIQ